MHFNFRQPLSFVSAAVLAVAFTIPQPSFAQSTNHATHQPSDHVVSPGDLQQSLQNATQTRQQDIDTLRGFLSSPQAQKALEQAHINPEQVRNGVAGLSDQELAQLSARATKAQNDFAAGMSNNDLLLIIVVLAIIILIIVAVR